jgi:amino-acid N-acetyltransferase
LAWQVEAHLSRALAVPVVRRHARGGIDSSDGFHYGPAVRIVSGNYVTGKRRGVVDGVDFGATGSGTPPPYL